MDRISNLCKIAFLLLLVNSCHPAVAQEQKPFEMLNLRVICSTIDSYINHAHSTGFSMQWMGETSTLNIQDSLWTSDTGWMLVRFLYDRQQACLLSVGTQQYINEEKINKEKT